MGKRRKGREIVLQSLYASLINGGPLRDVLDDQLRQRESATDTVEFARDLALKISTHKTELETWLGQLVSGGWSPERVGMVEKIVITMGLAELRYSPDVPWRAVINEALELARRFCDEDAVGFVNGVLDKAAAQTYPEIRGKETT
ncbi:MAG: transcription antitermination factor NusB [bacterium]|nr:transcription antitermination factor NusB [bacterium]